MNDMYEKAKRDTTFEVLRCICMIMIVAFHFMTHGTKIFHPDETLYFNLTNPMGGANYFIAETITVICSSAVDLFVILSGYFLITNEKLKIDKWIKVWFQLVFYSFGISLVFKFIMGNDISYMDLFKSLFPVKFNAYGFVTKYLGLLLLAPFIAKLVKTLSHKQFLVGLFILGFLQLDIYKFPYAYVYDNNLGGTLLFYVLLFCTGGYLRLYSKRCKIFFNKIHLPPSAILLLLISVSVMWGIYKGLIYMDNSMQANLVCFPYHSIPYFTATILFYCFTQIHIRESLISKFICSITPYTFGVYLIHDHNLMRQFIWHDLISENDLDSWYFLLMLFAVVIAIFVTSVLIDIGRSMLFSVLGMGKIYSNVRNYIKF